MTDPLSELELSLAKAALNAYRESHNHPGAFACCSAHPAADTVERLLAEIERLRADLADFSGHVNKLESRICDCTPEREHNDYKRPAFYQHEAHCRVVELTEETP
jgi:hypothetical protein